MFDLDEPFTCSRSIYLGVRKRRFRLLSREST